MRNHVTMKAMRLPVYRHNSLMIIHALGHMMYIYIYIYIYICISIIYIYNIAYIIHIYYTYIIHM